MHPAGQLFSHHCVHPNHLTVLADLPGTLDRHQKITPACRRRPDEEITMEVCDHVEASVDELLETYDEENDAVIHVAVTVER